MPKVIALPVTIELSDTAAPAGQRWASVKFGDTTLFSELVYDNETTPAENNIMLLFGSRLRELLERD
jgi:hypothetical protein